MAISKQKLAIIVGVVLFILILLIIPLILNRKPLQSGTPGLTNSSPNGGYVVAQAKPKIWQIYLDFNPQTQQLALHKIFVRNGTVVPEKTDTSVWHILVMDPNRKVLFDGPIHITEQLMFQLETIPTGAIQQKPLPITSSLVTIPYFADANLIIVTKYNVHVIDFPAPKF